MEKWWQLLEAARTHSDGSGKVVNALAMAASYDPDPSQFLGIRLPVTFDTCEVIEERWANWLRQDPVVAIEVQAGNLRRLKALYIDCGEKDQFNLLYGARRFVRRLNELGIAHRYEEFPDNHTAVDYRMDESLPFLAQTLTGWGAEAYWAKCDTCYPRRGSARGGERSFAATDQGVGVAPIDFPRATPEIAGAGNDRKSPSLLLFA